MQRSARDIDVNTNEADNPCAHELEGRIDELEGDRAVALLELLVSEYK